MLREFETCGMRLSERRALEKRWRGERRRSVPSESAVFRYLERFHDAGEEAMREAHRAFIPAPNGAMKGLRKVNADLVGFVQSRSPQTEATLDMDATLVETRKQEALHSYNKYSRIEHRRPCLEHRFVGDSAELPGRHAFFGLRTAIIGSEPLPYPQRRHPRP